MHYQSQEALPGGSIGPKEASTQGTRWRAPDADSEPDDAMLERTALRYGPDGWYIVTASAKQGRKGQSPGATSRCGPLPTWERAERELMLMTGAPEGAFGIELNDAQSAAVDAVLHEGLARRVYDAAQKWIWAMGARLESDALAGRFVPTDWQRNPRFADTGTPEGKRLHELYSEVCEAAAILQQWSEA